MACRQCDNEGVAAEIYELGGNILVWNLMPMA